MGALVVVGPAAENIIAAAIIAADPAAAQQKARQAEQQQGVWVGQSSDHGIKDIYIRTEAPNAIWFDATIDRVADSLAALGDTDSKDTSAAHARSGCWRSRNKHSTCSAPPPASPLVAMPTQTRRPQPPPSEQAVLTRGRRRPCTSTSAKTPSPATDGVARFEGVGPVTIDQVKKWLGHCQVTVKPVIDLTNQAPVDGYEVPDRLREAIHLRSPVDVFPYATNTTRTKQADHSDPYIDPGDGGPPGQTRLDNLAPMVTFHHRIKTHSRWHVKQVFNGVFVWRSPHGRCYLVDHNGTQTATKAA